MNAGHLRRAGALGAVLALGSLGLAGTAAQADQDGARAEGAKISMELEGKEVFFKGPNSVDAGTELEIVNNTDPAEIGPHSFTLVDKDLLPEFSKKAFKECFKEGVCASVFKAHKVDVEKETVGKKLVRAGKEGWDSSFGKRGDSWFALKQDQTFSQKVSAKAGSKLYYFCVVHPEMQGKLKVK